MIILFEGGGTVLKSFPWIGETGVSLARLLSRLLLLLLLLPSVPPQEVVPARAGPPAPGGPPEEVQIWRSHLNHGLMHGRGGPSR